jgi:DNA-binding phage protein
MNDQDDDRKIDLLLLNDALETGEPLEVAAVLGHLRSRNRSKIRSLQGGASMHLAEVLDILQGAGFRLVAVPTRRRTVGHGQG